MTLSDLKSRIFNNPNPIFNEELEFEEFVLLEAIGKKSIYFQRETRFLHGARFQGVTLNFERAFFVEKLTIGDVARIKFNVLPYYLRYHIRYRKMISHFWLA